jgi:glycosyltransferase involved in cell wall biosynthesis
MFSRFPADVDQPKGGVEAATVGLARGLGTRDDVDLHVVTLEKERKEDTVETCGFATVHRLAGGRLPMIVDVFNGPGRKKIDRYITGLRPDVVHFQETYGFGGPVNGVPTVFTVHGFDSLNLVTERKYLWRLRAPLWRLAEKKGIRSHRNVVSIAPYVTEQLRGLAAGEIVSIPNAVSREFFSVRSETVPGRVLFAGWINPRKNLATAISAVSKLVQQGKDVTLHAAGDFADRDYTARVRQLVGELGLRDRVQLLGRVSQERLRRELAEAAIFLLPSLQENAPMAIAEAMAAGVPVVTSNVCGMRTMVDDGRTGFLVEPRNVGQVAERIGVLLADEGLRQRMAADARKAALDSWHPDSVVEQTLALYRRIAGAPAGRANRVAAAAGRGRA